MKPLTKSPTSGEFLESSAFVSRKSDQNRPQPGGGWGGTDIIVLTMSLFLLESQLECFENACETENSPSPVGSSYFSPHSSDRFHGRKRATLFLSAAFQGEGLRPASRLLRGLALRPPSGRHGGAGGRLEDREWRWRGLGVRVGAENEGEAVGDAQQVGFFPRSPPLNRPGGRERAPTLLTSGA